MCGGGEGVWVEGLNIIEELDRAKMGAKVPFILALSLWTATSQVVYYEALMLVLRNLTAKDSAPGNSYTVIWRNFQVGVLLGVVTRRGFLGN